MGWGTMPETQAEREERLRLAQARPPVGFGVDAGTEEVTPRPYIALVTSGDYPRDYFHRLDEFRLRFNDIGASIVHTNGMSLTSIMCRRIEKASLIVIGTCKQKSGVAGSPTQRLEHEVFFFARMRRIPHALFCQHLHEATLPHLAPLRRSAAAVFVAEDYRENAGPFLEMFRHHVPIVHVDDSENGLDAVATTILSIVQPPEKSRRAEPAAPGWNWD